MQPNNVVDDDHRDDIRAASGGVDIKKDCGTERRQYDRIDKL